MRLGSLEECLLPTDEECESSLAHHAWYRRHVRVDHIHPLVGGGFGNFLRRGGADRAVQQHQRTRRCALKNAILAEHALENFLVGAHDHVNDRRCLRNGFRGRRGLGAFLARRFHRSRRYIEGDGINIGQF
jgi:hypothetical protein